MFGIDPVAMAKKEIVKVDLNKNGRADVVELLEGFDSSQKVFEPILDRLNGDDIAIVLMALNKLLGPARGEPVFSAEEIKNAATAFDASKLQAKQLPKAIEAIKEALQEPPKKK